MALLDGLSQIDKAQVDTMAHKCSPAWLDILARMGGLPRIQSILPKYWRKAFITANIAKRDSLGVIFSFVREALRGQDASIPVHVRSGDPYRTRIYAVSPSPGFTQADLFRYWEVNGVVYYSVGADAFSGDYVAFLELAPWKGPHWAAADWDTDPGVPDHFIQEQATRLPFLLRGYGNKVELVIEASSTVPPTFFQDETSGVADVPADGTLVFIDLGTASAAGKIKGLFASEGRTLGLQISENPQAFGGYVQVLGVDPSQLPTSGQFYKGADVYSYTGVSAAQPDGSFRLTGYGPVSASGVLLNGDVIAVDVPPARGAAYTVDFWVAGTLAATLTLGATDRTVSDDATEIVVAEGDAIGVIVHGTASVPLSGLAVSAMFERPAGQPLGGELLGDALADDPTAGPWPIYLEGGASEDWQRTLDRMVAFGVHPQARTSDHLHND